MGLVVQTLGGQGLSGAAAAVDQVTFVVSVRGLMGGAWGELFVFIVGNEGMACEKIFFQVDGSAGADLYQELLTFAEFELHFLASALIHAS